MDRLKKRCHFSLWREVFRASSSLSFGVEPLQSSCAKPLSVSKQLLRGAMGQVGSGRRTSDNRVVGAQTGDWTQPT